MIENEFYTLEQAAERLGVTKRWASDQISEGHLNAFKRGKRIYVLHSDIVAFVMGGKNMKGANIDEIDKPVPKVKKSKDKPTEG